MARIRKSLLTINPVRPDYSGALRAVICFLPPMLVGLAAGNLLAASVAGFAAQLVALVDTGGSFHSRLGQMGAFVAVAVGVVGAATLVASEPVAASALMAATAFCGAVLTIYGAFGAAFGMGLPVLTVVIIGMAPPTSEVWVVMGAALLAGLWAVLVSMVPWLIVRERPANLALARIYASAAALTAELGRPGVDWIDSAEVTQAREDFGAVLEQNVNHARRATAVGNPAEAVTEIIRVEDMIFSLIALREQANAGANRGQFATDLQVLYTSVAGQLTAMADAVSDGHKPPLAPQPLIESINSLADSNPDLAGQLSQLRGLLAREVNASVHVTSVRPWFETLLVQLNWSSAVLRHATRLAVAVAVATLLYLFTGLPEGAWVILTVVVLLKPDIGATLDRLVQRLVGTMIGVVVGGTLVVLLSPYPVLIAFVASAFLFGMVAFVRLNYVFWVMSLTPLVLLTVSLSDLGDWELGGWRLVNTIIGAILAIAATYLLWPSSAANGFRRALARELRLAAAYLAGAAVAAPADTRRRLQSRVFYAEIDVRQTLRVWRNEPGADERESESSEAMLREASHLRTLVMLFDSASQQGGVFNSNQLRDAGRGIADAEQVVDSGVRSKPADSVSVEPIQSGANSGDELAVAALDGIAAQSNALVQTAQR